MHKFSVAVYKLIEFDDLFIISEVEEYSEKSLSRVRVTEPQEVTFIDLPAAEVVPVQLDRLNTQHEEELKRHLTVVAEINERKQKLLAITHDDSIVDFCVNVNKSETDEA